jgi:hypothetical protein
LILGFKYAQIKIRGGCEKIILLNIYNPTVIAHTSGNGTSQTIFERERERKRERERERERGGGREREKARERESKREKAREIERKQ